MIEVKTKIHDRYSIEFKMGFVAGSQPEGSDFMVGMWIFVPASLDITPATFTHAEFYRSVKSNIRLITPQFKLSEIVRGNAVPLTNVTSATDDDYEYQLKFFSAIVKSSVRESRNVILAAPDGEREELCRSYADDIHEIFRTLDTLRSVSPGVCHKDCHDWCDEFLCNVVAQYSMDLFGQGSPSIASLLHKLDSRRAANGYGRIDPDDNNGNKEFIHRRGVLKKYVESLLFLRVPKKRDGVLMEQAYYSLAAGMAMIFATVVAWAFQRHFGNLTWPLFIALIISYMLKDRIKELMRFWFAHRLSDRYFDNKAKMSVHGTQIGSIKEAMDFIPSSKVPADVDAMRNGSHLFSAENDFADESIILYRKKVHLDINKMQKVSTYSFDGVNDIIRLQVRPFLRKMDDPEQGFFILDGNDVLKAVSCNKDYFVNIVLQYTYGSTTEYKRFRLDLNRDGIKGMEEIR